jgi:Glycosyltransferase family 87
MGKAREDPGSGAEGGWQLSHPYGSTLSWAGLLEGEDRIFTPRRLRVYGFGVVLACSVTVMLSWLLYRGDWVVRRDWKLANIDFCWIWVTGNFASSGDPGLIYDPLILAAAQDAFFRPGECLFIHLFDYPPILLFYTYPLGLLPYVSAFAVWIIATLLLYEVAVYSIVPRTVTLIAALAPGAVLKNIQLGHNGFLTAGLIGLSLVSMERRPWLSGMFLGLLTYKPQFGVLFPLALVASRNWRALGSAMATSLALVVTTAIAFGYQTWPAFIESLFNRNSSFSPDGEIELKLQSIYGLVHWAGASATVSWAVHVAVAVVTAAAVCVVWAKSVPHALKAAVLCIAALIVSPYVLAYDLCIVSIAVAFFVRDGTARGFQAGERTIISICLGGLFMVGVPIGPVICAALFFLTARRILALGPPLLAGSITHPGLGAGSPQAGSAVESTVGLNCTSSAMTSAPRRSYE